MAQPIIPPPIIATSVAGGLSMLIFLTRLINHPEIVYAKKSVYDKCLLLVASAICMFCGILTAYGSSQGLFYKVSFPQGTKLSSLADAKSSEVYTAHSRSVTCLFDLTR